LRRLHRTAIARLDEKSPRESGFAIRAEKRFWRAPMRRDAGERENFLIAKNCDSESARRAFEHHSRLNATPIAPAAQHA
jgi:hypothetical protein